MRELLKAFTGLAGAVVTIDAMHTQPDTAQAIPDRQADYVMTVKANTPTLYQQLKKLPWAAVPATSAVTTDHGRRVRRTIKAVLAPAWIGFDGAAQVAQLRRTVTRKGQKTVEVVYLIHQRPRRRPGHPGGLGPQPLGDRKPPSLGPRRHLSGRQIAGQNGKRAARDGLATQPGHQPAPHRRPHQHRCRQPPPRPRSAPDATAAPDRVNVFAGSLAYMAVLIDAIQMKIQDP